MRQEHQLPIQRGCRCVDLSRAAYYRAPRPAHERDREVIDALNALVEKYPRRGLYKSLPNAAPARAPLEPETGTSGVSPDGA